jgi:perosamine synthetase
MYKEIIQFIRSHYNKPDEFIPLHAPVFNGNERKYVLDAIDSTFVSSVGEYVNRFEQMMVELTGAKYAVAVVNGTSALHIALRLAGVEQNDEVLTQPLSFVATANAISYEKAIPHFIDVDEDTLGISPQSIEQRLNDIAELRDGVCYNKLTKRKISACVPMHTFGLPARIDQIVNVCNAFRIPVVEDAAESLGSYYKNQHTGTFGKLGTFSFNGNKTITCGGGGAIITNNEEFATRAKHITTTAKIHHQWDYVHDEIGYNYRMPNLNAAMACAQLEQLKNFLEDKRNTTEAYKTYFSTKPEVEFIEGISDSKSNYWLNAVRFKSQSDKEYFLSLSNENGVMTRPIWKLLSDLPMYKDCPKGDLSISRKLSNTIVNIPSSVRA